MGSRGDCLKKDNEPDNIVFYWSGVLPQIAELSILSALNRSRQSRVILFLDSDPGFEGELPESLRKLSLLKRFTVQPFSLREWASAVDSRRPNAVIDQFRVLMAKIMTGKKVPGSLVGGKIQAFFEKALGYWHKDFGWWPRASLMSSISWGGLPYRSDVFRMLLPSKFEGESVLYSDLDVYFSASFTQWPLRSSFTYTWGQETWANTAILFFHESRKMMQSSLMAKFVDGLPALPWFLFTAQNCSQAEIEILNVNLFDPGWTPGSIAQGDTSLFFKNTSATGEFLSEIRANFLAVHWHNHWKVMPEGGSPFDCLLAVERRLIGATQT